MRAGLWIRIVAWWRGGRVIWCKDFQDEVKLTVAVSTPFGLHAPVFYGSNVGGFTLKPDGSCGGSSSYIKEWRPYDRSQWSSKEYSPHE